MQKELNCFLIDNDEDDQEIFALALRDVDASISCTMVSNGLQAIEKLGAESSHVPSFIFIDMNMPLMNGKQCLVELKKIPRLAPIPIYMYSTAANPLLIDEVKAMGAKDFIVKPTSFQELTKVLSKIILIPNPLLEI